METIGPSALVVAILYVLSRWALTTVEFAVTHPGKGNPQVSWKITWYLALAVSALGTTSIHLRLLDGHWPGKGVLIFNAMVFGGFLLGFLVTGHCDHKVRLGLRGGGSSSS